MLAFPQPHYKPCFDCGASVARDESEQHVCDEERRLDYAVLQLRGEVEEFADQLVTYLASPQGQFEAWYAARRR